MSMPTAPPDEFSNQPGTVYVVEDDDQTRQALVALFSDAVSVASFGSAEEFLQHPPAVGPGCLLVDQRLPGMSGCELLRQLQTEQRSVPAVLVTAYADTASTVLAMRHGATTVFDKPCGGGVLREAVLDAIKKDRKNLHKRKLREAASSTIERLSPSEREVLGMVLDGVPNKQIARRLGVCVRTIESRRSKIYQATGVGSVAELVRFCAAAGVVDSYDGA